MTLGELQQQLAASLAHGAPAPPSCDAQALAGARRGLEAKRRRAAAKLLPRTRAALGGGWSGTFHRHVESYAPSAMLYHVDDAWELARRLAAGGLPGGGGAVAAPPAAVRRAARADLLELKLWYARARRPGATRIRERRSFLLALVFPPETELIVRLPGALGAVYRWRWSGRPENLE
jgi:hypothetical protein